MREQKKGICPCGINFKRSEHRVCHSDPCFASLIKNKLDSLYVHNLSGLRRQFAKEKRDWLFAWQICYRGLAGQAVMSRQPQFRVDSTNDLTSASLEMACEVC